MSDQEWELLFRSPRSTVTRALRSPAFTESRKQAGVIIENASALRALADQVMALEHERAPLVMTWDRVTAAVGLLRSLADSLEDKQSPSARLRATDTDTAVDSASPMAREARERLVIAALHYLITPVDLIPDFRAGGYIDDVLVLSWVFGAAVVELEPFLDSEGADG